MTLHLDRTEGSGPWAARVAQYDDTPVYHDPDTGHAVYPGYTYAEDAEPEQVADGLEVLPHSVHPSTGAQNTSESMAAAGMTHSETHFDPLTGIVTEIWDNEVPEGEIRAQTIASGGDRGLELMTGYNRNVPIVRPSAYRKEDPVPDGFNTEAAYFELARQQVANRIRSDNNILNDFRPAVIRDSAGVIEPDIRIRPYAPNTARNVMDRELIGRTAVHSDAPMMPQGVTVLGDEQTHRFEPGAGRGGTVDAAPRPYGVISGVLDEVPGEAAMYASAARGGGLAPSSSLLPTRTTAVESVGVTPITAFELALDGGLADAAPRHGLYTPRPIDNQLTEVTRMAPAMTLLPTRVPRANLSVATRPLDFETTNIAHLANVTPHTGTQDQARATFLEGALHGGKSTKTEMARGTPQWQPHGVNHGSFAFRNGHRRDAMMNASGATIRQGDAVGEVATGILRPSRRLHDHTTGAFMEPAGESDIAGRTYTDGLLEQFPTMAADRPHDLIAL